MKYSTSKNTTQYGRPFVFVEEGDILYFDSEREYLVTEIKGSRPFHNELDLFQLWKDTGIHPVVLSDKKL